MRTKNPMKVFITLLVIAAVVVLVVQLYLVPQKQKEDAAYQQSKKVLETHDISETFRYQTATMKDAAKMVGIFQSLPLGSVEKEYFSDDNRLSFGVKFHGQSGEAARGDLLYTAVAAFVSADDLKYVDFVFTDEKCTFERDKTLAEFGTVENLRKTRGWTAGVRDILKDKEKAEALFQQLFETEKTEASSAEGSGAA